MAIENSKEKLCETLRHYAKCIENGSLNGYGYVEKHITDDKSHISFYIEDSVSSNEICRQIAEQMGSPY